MCIARAQAVIQNGANASLARICTGCRVDAQMDPSASAMGHKKTTRKVLVFMEEARNLLNHLSNVEDILGGILDIAPKTGLQGVAML